jgi:hypothetical protein
MYGKKMGPMKPGNKPKPGAKTPSGKKRPPAGM